MFGWARPGHHLGLVHEHVEELLVVGEVGQDALQGHDLLEALDAGPLGLEDLGHAADRHPVEELVGPEAVVAPRRLARGGGRRAGGGSGSGSRGLLLDRALRDRGEVEPGPDRDLRVGDRELRPGAGARRAAGGPPRRPITGAAGGRSTPRRARRGGRTRRPPRRPRGRAGASVGPAGPRLRLVRERGEGAGRDGVAHLHPDRALPRGPSGLPGRAGARPRGRRRGPPTSGGRRPRRARAPGARAGPSSLPPPPLIALARDPRCGSISPRRP